MPWFENLSLRKQRVNVLNFYLSKNGMILVDRRER